MADKFNPQDLNRAERWFRQGIPEGLAGPNGRSLSGIPLRKDSDTQVEQDGRFNDRASYLAERNVHLLPTSLLTNQLSIVFPSVEGYGPEHGKRVSQLACYIAEVLGVTSTDDLETVKTAGLLHDLGRVRPWGQEDHQHAARGAEMADRFLRADPVGCRTPLRDPVCRLVARHGEVGQGPLEQALRDADLLESSRHWVNSGEGFRAIQEAQKKLQTPWAQDGMAMRRVAERHGWDVVVWGV